MALLHTVWVGGPLPPLFESYIEGWRERHASWDYVHWTDCPPEFQVYPLFRDARNHVPERNIGQFCSDLIRYEALYRLGGVYVDTDMEPRKPIDDLLGPECWACWEKQDAWVGNAVLGAKAGASFLEAVLEELPRSLERNKGKRPNVSTGPQLVTRLHRKKPGLTVYDQGLFYPYAYGEWDRSNDDFPDARGVHRWSNKTGAGRA